MTQKSKLTRWGFCLIFCMFMGFGISVDSEHFKTVYGHEMYLILVSLAFAGLGVSIFNTAGIAWVVWQDAKAFDLHRSNT